MPCVAQGLLWPDGTNLFRTHPCTRQGGLTDADLQIGGAGRKRKSRQVGRVLKLLTDFIANSRLPQDLEGQVFQIRLA
jgi:hypothetical protein